MLSRNSARAVVAAMVILFAAAFNHNVLWATWVPGDLITYPQGMWSNDPTASGLLFNNYDSVYSSSLGTLQVGIPGLAGFAIEFSDAQYVMDYLPASGTLGPLNADLLNPTSTSSGGFGGEVLTLRLNIDFSDAGVTLGNLGIPFGDLQLRNFDLQSNLNGLTVRQLLGQANNLLGGGSSFFYSIAELGGITVQLNSAFGGGDVGQFAQDHLRIPTTSWNVNGPGSFTDANNWNNGVPLANDAAVFNRNLNIQYNVTFPGRPILTPLTREIRQLIVGFNAVSFADSVDLNQLPASLSVDAANVLGSLGIIIGESAGQVAVLNTRLKSFSGVAATIGNAAGSSGTLNVNAGTFSLSGEAVTYVGLEGTGALNVNNGAAVNVSGAIYLGVSPSSNGTLNVSGAGSTLTSDDLVVAENGTGTLTIQNGGTVSVSGLLSVGSQGTVQGNGNISGDINNVGTVNPGNLLVPNPENSFGALHVDGFYTQAATGILRIDLGGTTPDTQYDQLLVSGAVSLNGTLQVFLLNPFMPAAGNAFNILDGESLSGAFSTVQLPTLSAGIMWNASRLYTAGILRVTILGDYNANGMVDTADYTVWRNSTGQSGMGLAADGNLDGMITRLDFDVWKARYGQSHGSGSSATVPEPSTIILLLCAVALSMGRRRTK